MLHQQLFFLQQMTQQQSRDWSFNQALFVEPFEHSSYFTNLLNDGNFDEFNTESVDHIGQSPQAESITKKTRGGNFTVEEDEMIITAWLNVSLDAVQGNDQKSKTYWQRVWEYFNNYKSQADCSRTTISLMNRWSAIQLATNKFCGCFSQIERLDQSGLAEKDKIRDAKKLYKELYKSTFQFEHCWNELRYEPKWMKDSQRKKQKTKGAVTLCSSTPTLESVNLGDDDSGSYGGLARSHGRKVDKERVRKSKNKLFGGYDTSSYFVKLLEDMKEEKKIMNEKKVEMLERCSLQEQEQERLDQEKERLEQEKKRLDHEKARLDHEKARMQMEQLRDEERIMLMDTSVMPPMQAEYYKRRQMKILEKKM